MIQTFINYLIHLLGGLTKEEYYSNCSIRDGHVRDKVDDLNKIQRFMEQQLTIERANYNELQMTMFKKLGIIPSEAITENAAEHFQPIKPARTSWTQRRQELERHHRALAEERPVESVKTEEYWTSKSTKEN